MDNLSLLKVLEGFNAPLNEEQAWAVCFQCAKFLQEAPPERRCSFNDVRCVILSKDGSVEVQPESKGKVCAETELVQSLGVVVFRALDFGLSESEEQKLSHPLEDLLERMTGSGEEEDGEDEGIEGDASEEDGRITLREVMQVCSDHLQPPLEGASHYKAVCRALVAEAVELATFLEKMASSSEEADDHDCVDAEMDQLEKLKRADWARLWIQVMSELRHGAQLKKVEHISNHSLEFELTPYEILMEDIRSRRYTLNKVMVDGDIPSRMKKDAHDLILEFIRSRPPLHPMRERQLKDMPPKRLDPREQLMASIRQEQQLRPTPGRIIESSRTKLNDDDATPQPSRKIIKPDLNLLMSNSFDEDDLMDSDDDDDNVFEDKNKVTPQPLEPFTPLSPKSPPSQMPWQQTAELDPAVKAILMNQQRRRSITVCESPSNPPVKSPIGGTTAPRIDRKKPAAAYLSEIMTADYSYQPRTLQSSLECLSLTIEEVMHIRSVLTKAELECLIVDPELHAAVLKGKICFTCKETKFSIFGQWATRCKFCQRQVCSACVSKMAIPTEHFEHIPVYTLSPSPLTPTRSSHLVATTKTGSAPSSPDSKRKSSPMIHLSPSPNSNSSSSSPKSVAGNLSHHSNSPVSESKTSASPKRGILQRAKTLAKGAEAIEGPLMNICRDCKAMIVNIIRASRTCLATAPDLQKIYGDCPSRKASRNFHLDLKPVYKAH